MQLFKRVMPQLVHSLKPGTIKGCLLSTPTITEALLRPINVPSPMRSINWIGKWIIVSMCNHCIDKLIFRLDPEGKLKKEPMNLRAQHRAQKERQNIEKQNQIEDGVNSRRLLRKENPLLLPEEIVNLITSFLNPKAKVLNPEAKANTLSKLFSLVC